MKRKYLIVFSVLFALLLVAGPAAANSSSSESGSSSALNFNWSDNSQHKSHGSVSHPGMIQPLLPHAAPVEPMPKPDDDYKFLPAIYLGEYTMEEIACGVKGHFWGADTEYSFIRKMPKDFRKAPVKVLGHNPNGTGIRLIGEVIVTGREDAPVLQALMYGLKEAKKRGNAVVVTVEYKERFRGTNKVAAFGAVGGASFATTGGNVAGGRILQVGGGWGIGKSSAELTDIQVLRIRIWNMKA